MSVYEPNHSEKYWNILQNNIEWLRASETKATLILTLYGVVFTIAYTNSTAIFESIQSSGWVLHLVFFCGILSLISIIYAFLSVNPKLTNKNPNSIIYFGHISQRFNSCAVYKIHAHSIIDDENLFTDHLTEQIYIISAIAWKKYKHVAWSIRFFCLSLGVLIITLFVYLSKAY